MQNTWEIKESWWYFCKDKDLLNPIIPHTATFINAVCGAEEGKGRTLLTYLFQPVRGHAGKRLRTITIMDVNICLPEALLLRNIKARASSETLVGLFCRFELPKQVRHNQGTNFVSGVCHSILDAFQLCVSLVLHKQFHPRCWTGSSDSQNYVKDLQHSVPLRWDEAFLLLLFAVSDFYGLTAFKLVFDCEVRGPLKLFQEQLLQP